MMDRRGKDALALDQIPIPGASVQPGFDPIPMWIADMNFPTAPSIIQEIQSRASHPAFGYFRPSQAYFDAIIRWQQERNGVTGLTEEAIGYENGVLGCLASALRAFTSPGEGIFLHAPAYVGFQHCLKRTGRRPVYSFLKKDREGVWRMDLAGMDRVIRDHHIHFAIFCSPHNPAGRVWERRELEGAMEVFRKNDCIVFSDEIWSDLTLPGFRHIPLQAISEDARSRVIAAYAPSKTFNLAGLVGSYHIIYDPCLRDRVSYEAAATGYNGMNVLSMHALIGGYSPEGAAWLEELRHVLQENTSFAAAFIREHFEGVEAASPEGTYMLYLDVGSWCRAHDMSVDELLKKGVSVGVLWQDGRPFQVPDTIRMNLASPFSRVEEAFKRLDRYVFNG